MSDGIRGLPGMATNLRDLDADQRFLDSYTGIDPGTDPLWDIADAALDEIDGFRRLLVRPWPAGGFVVTALTLPEPHGGIAMHSHRGFDGWWFKEKDDAWTAARKAAIGK